jgi:pimeloyl-ACP methyl ester carboxylesterase
VLAANEVIRRREDIDPDSIERPGAMFYIRGEGLHVVEAGSGPPLLMLHGYGGSIENFGEQVGPLARHFRVIALDLLGFGLSDRTPDAGYSLTAHTERVRAFLDRMGIDRAALLGHSMGGAIAMRLAAAQPERVDRLIVCAGAAPDDVHRRPWLPLVQPLFPLPAAVLWSNPRLLRRAVRRVTYDPQFLTDERWERYRRPMRLRGTAAALMKMANDVRLDQPVDPGAVTTRTLLLWGEADPVVPLRVAHRLHQTMPDARLEVVPRAGHLVLEERPEACSEIILRFLGLPAGAGTVVAS